MWSKSTKQRRAALRRRSALKATVDFEYIEPGKRFGFRPVRMTREELMKLYPPRGAPN